MFESEKAMQSWLSDQLKKADGIHSLIIKPDWNIESFNYQEAKIFESYRYCLTNLMETSVVCEDVDISQRENECLKPDFLLYSNGYETFAIVELKNISNPTRQTATELAAYANALKSYFPRIADGDIFYVVVSNEWPTLLMNYLLHDIYYLNKKILCLKPRCHENNILLECINPRQFRDQIDRDTITEDSFNGYQVCLYGNNVYKGGDISEL